MSQSYGLSYVLMEAKFNAMNKIIYGHQVSDTVQKYRLMLEEIFSNQNCLSDDGTLTKVLFYNIAWQTHLPAGISAVDADNCYNHIAHPIPLLVFQALGVPIEGSILFVINDPRCEVLPTNRIRQLTGIFRHHRQHQDSGNVPGQWCSRHRMDRDKHQYDQRPQKEGPWSSHSHAYDQEQATPCGISLCQ